MNKNKSNSTPHPQMTSCTKSTGNGVSVTSSPICRLKPNSVLDEVGLVRARLYANALVTIGTDMAAAAASATTSGQPFSMSVSKQNRLLMKELANVAARNASSGANSTHIKSNGSSSLLANMAVSTEPSAADLTANGPDTSTTTGQERDNNFTCGVCNRSFSHKHVLKTHEWIHMGVKLFECRECHEKFMGNHHLKNHMRLHTGEMPYKCAYCHMQFTQVVNLTRHLRVHTGERPYACKLCAKRFADFNQLKAHLLIHTKDKPRRDRPPKADIASSVPPVVSHSAIGDVGPELYLIQSYRSKCRRKPRQITRILRPQHWPQRRHNAIVYYGNWHKCQMLTWLFTQDMN